MYEDKEMALAVEEHCSPAVWRKFPYQDGDPF
jgi:hypothetical protein